MSSGVWRSVVFGAAAAGGQSCQRDSSATYSECVWGVLPYRIQRMSVGCTAIPHEVNVYRVYCRTVFVGLVYCRTAGWRWAATHHLVIVCGCAAVGEGALLGVGGMWCRDATRHAAGVCGQCGRVCCGFPGEGGRCVNGPFSPRKRCPHPPRMSMSVLAGLRAGGEEGEACVCVLLVSVHACVGVPLGRVSGLGLPL